MNPILDGRFKESSLSFRLVYRSGRGLYFKIFSLKVFQHQKFPKSYRPCEHISEPYIRFSDNQDEGRIGEIRDLQYVRTKDAGR